ncbi:ABC transporter substrate-binding protein [Oerskovia sp. M15]
MFGIDNSFATRAIDEGVLEPYTPAGLADSAAEYAVGDGELSAVDLGDVCVNVDHAWFTAAGITEPATLDDLTKPEYKDLLVVTNPRPRRPGCPSCSRPSAPTARTAGRATGASSRTTASRSPTGGPTPTTSTSPAPRARARAPRAVVLDVPAFTVTEDGRSTTTGALLDTCFRQVEYAGVLAGAENPEGAKKLVDFLVSDAFQVDIADNMYMYPANADTELPEGGPSSRRWPRSRSTSRRPTSRRTGTRGSRRGRRR